jgi:hypothetical protein
VSALATATMVDGIGALGGAAARAWLGGGPLPPTMGPPGGPGGACGAIDVHALLMLSVVVFAFVGYLRGVDAAWRLAAIVALGYWLLDRRWDFVVAWVNHFYRLFVFALVKGGIFTDDPTAVWKEVRAAGALIPTTSPALMWRLTGFTVIFVAGYVVATLTAGSPSAGALYVYRPRNFIERLLGAVAGGVSGYLFALFYLSRLFPAALACSGALGGLAGAVVAGLGPAIILSTVVLMIVFGVISLGQKRKKVYD